MKASALKIRQRILLRMISRSGSKINKLKLMKLSFLFANKTHTECFYQFVPYKYGPFSFTLYNELNTLAQNKLIDNSVETDVSIGSNLPAKAFYLDSILEKKFETFWERYSELSTKQIVDYVYDGYPWFTALCELKERRTAKVGKAASAVYTVGYEGLHIDGFLNLLLENGIQRIVDVRFNPLSRVYGFHKTTISRISSYLGIEYCHFPKLGIPPELRNNLNCFDDYESLFEQYRIHVLNGNSESINSVSKLIKQKSSVLMCQEANPSYCHRSHLAQDISGITKLNIYDIRENYESQSSN